jgi:hypothetical protein
MFCFWSIALYGEASRKSNPAWYWLYGLLNAIMALAGLYALFVLL